MFISYSRKDKRWLNLIKIAIKPLVKQGEIIVFDDTQLSLGRWRDELDREMSSSGIALFLGSLNFLASDFIQEVELRHFLWEHEHGGLRICWIALTAAYYEGCPLIEFQCLNDPNNPLDKLDGANRTEALAEITRKIAKYLR